MAGSSPGGITEDREASRASQPNSQLLPPGFGACSEA